MILYNDPPREYLSGVFFFGMGIQILYSLILSIIFVVVMVSSAHIDPSMVILAAFPVAMLVTSVALLIKCKKSAFKIFTFLSLLDMVFKIIVFLWILAIIQAVFIVYVLSKDWKHFE